MRALTVSLGLMFVVGGAGAGASGAVSSSPEPARTQVHAASTAAGATAARSSSSRWSGSVDVFDRDAVDAAYARQYEPGLDSPTGWTGSHTGCGAGTSSAASRAATLRAVNYVRSLGGLAPVSFSSTLNARSQLTALIMSANRSLSHTPPRSWRCWTGTGAGNAGRSNLALSYPDITSAGLVGLYMTETGSGNRAVGHRRWLMNPFTTSMGTGSTDTANAMTVIGPTSSSRPNPTWVSWPTAGYFPDALEPAGRWSLSAGSSAISFRSASVRVYRNGSLVRTVKNPVENGYARPTIVWQMPASTARSGSFRVVVNGIRRSGTSKVYSRSYWVRMFTPSS